MAAAEGATLLRDSPVIDLAIQALVTRLAGSSQGREPSKRGTAKQADGDPEKGTTETEKDLFSLGLAVLDAFLQANVTGPVLPAEVACLQKFTETWTSTNQANGTVIREDKALDHLRKACLKDLEVDGVSPYAHIPHLELFSLARHIFVDRLPLAVSYDEFDLSPPRGKQSLAWTQLRIHAWHYKLLTQPSLTSGSNFTRSSQWSDVPTLASHIVNAIDLARSRVLGEVWEASESWSRDDSVQFLLEAANCHILLGRYDKSTEALKEAARISGLEYALSGALGKRTKFQEKSTSQLVVLAKSSDKDAASASVAGAGEEEAKPDALRLDDDTLLEEIHFTKQPNGNKPTETIPESLADLTPDDQPQLKPLDQIILLAEATLRDAFSPLDTLTTEEVLPYAVRVISDKSTNWQIYTQALLVRSRIELHRSRTLERGVLQLQAVADQVLTDTTAAESVDNQAQGGNDSQSGVPTIQLTAPDATSLPVEKPTSFLPAPNPSESAPAHVRLRYIHALSTPPRWHLESELAYAWAGVGSLGSALEIFKRLRLWAEVALCLASSAAADDEDGRGSGGEEKATGIIRWRLFHRTGDESSKDSDDEDIEDVTKIKPTDFFGRERDPPANASRLWCILGDLEDNPDHYQRAWDVSNHRYARAQRSLGEYYLRRKDWEQARGAYVKATTVNRLSSEMWSRLGDINLRLADFGAAADAYGRAIANATDVEGGEDARTWSNLGSALWSLYREVESEKNESHTTETRDNGDGEIKSSGEQQATVTRDRTKLLSQALAAYKKGASIAHDNWRIWDNVLTLASRIHPTPVSDTVIALSNILRIRQTEEALDGDVLAALLQDVVLSEDKTDGTGAPDSSEGIYEFPRGSHQRLVARFLEEDVGPIITYRAELWTLLARLRAWRRDYAGAIEASERAWRAAMGPNSSSSSLGPNSETQKGADWTVDEAAWRDLVRRTEDLAAALETWGPDILGQKWKGRVRSAVRSVMGKGKESWEATEGWKTLQGILDGLKG